MIRCVVLVVLVCILSGCGTPIAAPPVTASATPPATGPVDQQRRYHDGQRWITATVLLDRLLLERGTAPGVTTARELYLLRKPVSSVAALEDVARQMRAAQPDISNLSAFIEESRPAGVRQQRLTRQVAVRGAPGVDVAALVMHQGARVVRTFDDTPDIVIAESTAPELLAAFVLAERLRTSAGVVAAIPLSE
jgi:hypothetical protein